MWIEMSQSIPNSAVTSETTMIPDGIAAHDGSPETRSLNLPRRPSTATFPLRWPMPSQSRSALTNMAAPVAIATWSSAAPAAGRAVRRADMAVNVTLFGVTLCDVTPLGDTLDPDADDRRAGPRDRSDRPQRPLPPRARA